ncbi:MAG: RDD family protein [Cytophagales bacterium]|nr:RDD family protein [Cytophagales bacterium]
MAYLKVHTAQNVLLEYTVGNIGQRLLAALLDLAICGVYIWFAQWIFQGLFSADLFDGDPGMLFWVIIILPVISYLPLIEYLWNGKTLGKAALKLQIIRTDGSAPSMGDIILRWLVRTIDVKLGFLMIFFIPRSPGSAAEETFMIWAMILFLLPLPIVGIISMATSPIGQRLGDRLANTVVIQSKRLFSLEDTLLKATEDDYQPRYLNVLKLSDKDIYIIKTTVDEAEKTHNYKNTGVLAEKAKVILEINDNERPFIFLKTLLNDYNHLAKQRDMNG